MHAVVVRFQDGGMRDARDRFVLASEEAMAAAVVAFNSADLQRDIAAERIAQREINTRLLRLADKRANGVARYVIFGNRLGNGSLIHASRDSVLRLRRFRLRGRGGFFGLRRSRK